MKIVMYHYIRNFKKNFPFFNKFLEKREFIKQVNYFQKSKGIIKNINEINNLQSKYLLTFDDGLKEQIFAAEILAKKGLTGIFFIPSLPILEKKILDVHKIQILLAKVGVKKIIEYTNKNKIYKFAVKKIKKTDLKKFSKTYSYNKDKKINIIFKRNMNYLIDSKIRSKILNEMFIEFKISETAEKYYMNISDINYIRKLGMHIGYHGHTHSLLSKLSFKDQEKEILKSKKLLEKKIKCKFNFFCFPYGRKYSYNKSTLKILKNNKFKYAFSVENRDVNKSDLQKKYELPRFDTNYFKNDY